MGEITFTPLQQSIFNAITQHPDLPKSFYFTGGTALSAIYFHHRESDDLDFFSEKDFSDESMREIMNDIAASQKLILRYTKQYRSRIFELLKTETRMIKVDFVNHPYKRLEKGTMIKEFPVDSLRDIATNKLLTINQRTEVKDFVDLYFLLKKFSVWDLLYSVKGKYNIELDIILVASDFLKVENFNFLPKMTKPFTLEELRSFFRQKAKELGMKTIE